MRNLKKILIVFKQNQLKTANLLQDIASLEQQISSQITRIEMLEQENFQLTQTLNELRTFVQTVQPNTSKQDMSFTASSLPSIASNQLIELLIENNNHQQFSNEQLQAITFDMSTHLSIIAGAGSGKTQTICAKAAYLILNNQALPSQIMMCTFSKKAQLEMEARVRQYLPNIDWGMINVRTFNSWFNAEYISLINNNEQLASIGISGQADESKYEALIQKLLKKHYLISFSTYGQYSISARLDYWYNMNFDNSQIIQFVARFFNSKITCTNGKSLSDNFANFLTELTVLKQKLQLITFTDQLLNLKQLLLASSHALNELRLKYKYIFIDEFQDINPLQKSIIELICPPSKMLIANCPKLIIVGDDDQSIYAFRGSNPEFIKTFKQEYMQTELSLMTNYRSDSAIITAANLIIANNKHRIAKQMLPHNNFEDAQLQVLPFETTTLEDEWICQKIMEIARANTQQTVANFRDILILYPTKFELSSLLLQFHKFKIPFITNQANVDVMGIFEIETFKTVFLSFLNYDLNFSNNNSHSNLQLSLFQKFCFCFFIPITASTTFFKTIDALTTSNLLLFITTASKYPLKLNTRLLNSGIDYFLDFVKTRELNYQFFTNFLLNTPLFQKKLTNFELLHIQTELSSFNSWEDLKTNYQKLKVIQQNLNNQLKQAEQGTLNAITILSIHASKGLGFKNVIIKGAYNGAIPNLYTTDMTDNNLKLAIQQAEPPTLLEEQRRLMYVAITRAKRQLYITYPLNVNGERVFVSPFLIEANLVTIDNQTKFEKYLKSKL